MDPYTYRVYIVVNGCKLYVCDLSSDFPDKDGRYQYLRFSLSAEDALVMDLLTVEDVDVHIAALNPHNEVVGRCAVPNKVS